MLCVQLLRSGCLCLLGACQLALPEPGVISEVRVGAQPLYICSLLVLGEEPLQCVGLFAAASGAHLATVPLFPSGVGAPSALFLICMTSAAVIKTRLLPVIIYIAAGAVIMLAAGGVVLPHSLSLL